MRPFPCRPSSGATTIEQYCPRRDSWWQVAVMSGRRLQCGVAVLEERLYVVGGRDGLKTLNTVECYNPRSNSWSAMPPMATNRHGLGGHSHWGAGPGAVRGGARCSLGCGP